MSKKNPIKTTGPTIAELFKLCKAKEQQHGNIEQYQHQKLILPDSASKDQEQQIKGEQLEYDNSDSIDFSGSNIIREISPNSQSGCTLAYWKSQLPIFQQKYYDILSMGIPQLHLSETYIGQELAHFKANNKSQQEYLLRRVICLFVECYQYEINTEDELIESITTFLSQYTIDIDYFFTDILWVQKIFQWFRVYDYSPTNTNFQVEQIQFDYIKLFNLLENPNYPRQLNKYTHLTVQHKAYECIIIQKVFQWEIREELRNIYAIRQYIRTVLTCLHQVIQSIEAFTQTKTQEDEFKYVMTISDKYRQLLRTQQTQVRLESAQKDGQKYVKLTEQKKSVNKQEEKQNNVCNQSLLKFNIQL